ncbi:hypothetical protein A1359_19200 [Methylomonas lenta]|uniref:Cobalamin ABC transporter n=1 Tax=Methylomonas lenta TaxID=980561 RepID=A0A177NUV0_9GAMM|nr:hypothetical protein [Methylomonas lenta]OAI21552.1 hypothetical protein A1359_19200 [Methylomonas lenta]
MTTKSTLALKPGLIALMALMAATRFHHFGTPFALPDASLAIFFLAGLWLGGRYLFAILLAEAGLIDYLAITKLGVSDFCVSQAYVFLIPTYAAMWLGGKWCRQFETQTPTALAQQFIALVVATSSAFLLSNGSFYILSGRYPEGNWTQYIERFAMYYPPYMTSTLIYGVLIFAVVNAAKSLISHKTPQQTI